MGQQQIKVGDRVTVVNVSGVPGTAYAGVSGTVARITGDLVRLAYSLDGKARECVVVQRRLQVRA